MMLLGAADPKLAWYVSRSAGMVAWALVSASIVWGLVLSAKTVRRRGAPAWFLDLHRFLATMAIVLVVIHVIALLFDDYARIVVRELVLPFASAPRQGYRPAPMAWGIVGAYVLVALQITSWLMHRLPRRVWHAIHLGSFLLFAVATVHAFQIGTDRRNLLVEWIAMTASALVAAMVVVRIGSLLRRRRRVARSASASSSTTSGTAWSHSGQGDHARPGGTEKDRVLSDA